jgi:hypothetical protein
MIDALRGVAAIWVACFHFYGGLSNQFTRHTFVNPFHFILAHGNAGVEIFFVISGFVIAYSVRARRVTPGYFGQFVLRRSVRLEPPYWTTIGLAIASLWLSNHLRTDRVAQLPSVAKVVAHIFYLQGFLHQGQIVDVFWTLCMEVQFYVFFLLLVAISQRLGDGRVSRLAVLAPLTVLSLAIHAGLIPQPTAWMFKFWYLFQLGVVAYWATSKQLKHSDFVAYLILLVGLLAWHPSVTGGMGLLTGLLIYLGARYNFLSTLNYAPLQFLGRRSYSLYLIHPVIGVPFAYFFAKKFFGAPVSASAAIVCMLTAIAVSLVGASLLYIFVERPSVELSSRLKGKSRRRDPLAVVEAQAAP